MEENILQKVFFKKNPLQELSAAVIADFGAKTILIDSINEKMNDIVGMSVSKERRTQAEQDQQDVAQLSNGEDIVWYMRKDHDVMVDSLLCKKALLLIDDTGPLIVKRYKTTGQDSFIELAFRILVHADKRYAEELFAMYHDIRNPYAQAMACLLFGEHNMQAAVPFLVKEYKRFQTYYSNDDFDQFPLLALYILFGEA